MSPLATLRGECPTSFFIAISQICLGFSLAPTPKFLRQARTALCFWLQSFLDVVGYVAEAAPRHNETAIVLGRNLWRQSSEELAVGAVKGRLEKDALRTV